ncbi:MAG: methyltransferase domain-containing protein [bacterium]
MFKLKDNIYDFVIMSHVVEHLLNIDSFLKKVNEILTDKGLLLIFVPDSYKAYEPGNLPHTLYFTEETLISMITKY